MANGFTSPGEAWGAPPPGHRLARRWIWVPFVAGIAIAPLVLSVFYVVPSMVFAATPMAIYLGVWVVFRQLDAPRASRPPPPPRDPRPPDPRPRPRTPGSPRGIRRARLTVARRHAPAA